jgi:hypothetical protein
MIRLSLEMEVGQLNLSQAVLANSSLPFSHRGALLDPRAIIHALEMRGNDIETSRAC